MNLIINTQLVEHLIQKQFPQWATLPIYPVSNNGWDNKTFHLGDAMLIRLPSAASYAAQVEKEQHWLPKLAPSLPLEIPEPLAMGMPSQEYPWKWSIYRWIAGYSAAETPITDLCKFAHDLAQFLQALQAINTQGAPLPGADNFYRGGSLHPYDTQARQAITLLQDKLPTSLVTEIWERALATSWQNPSVWVHGDISLANLLMDKGRLIAVIDFGQLAAGDPACDLAITWTLFTRKSREVFRQLLPFDENTWLRGRAWTLWKALIVAAGLTNTNAPEAKKAWYIINEVLQDYQKSSA